MALTLAAFGRECGDALLQPHQIVVAHEDALALGVGHLHLVRLRTLDEQQRRKTSTNIVQLVCVVDRAPTASGAALARGHVLVHSWVMQFLQVFDGCAVDIERVERHSPPAMDPAIILVSVQAKYPVSLGVNMAPPASIAGASIPDTTSQAESDAIVSHAGLLPESVRLGKINLERATLRQLRGMFGHGLSASALSPRQLLPVRILKELYVLRIESVRSQRRESGNKAESPIAVEVVGLDSTAIVANSSSSTTETQEPLDDDINSVTLMSDEQLEARLAAQGFVGYTDAMRDVLLHLSLALNASSAYSSPVIDLRAIGSHGVVLTGVHGVGKSLALKTIEKELVRKGVTTWRVDALSLLMDFENSSKPTAYEYLSERIERLAPGYSSGVPSGRLAILIDDMEALFRSTDGQIVDENTQTQHLPPLASSLLRMLDELRLDGVNGTGSKDSEEIVTDFAARLATLTGGYIAKDLVSICRSATVAAFARAHLAENEGAVTWTDLVAAQQAIKPSQLRELNVLAPGMAGSMNFVGYRDVVKELFEFVSWKFHPTAVVQRLGLDHSAGILLYGPSGCGKSLLVKELTAQARVNCVSVKSSELVSKYVGDSERGIRQLFARARKAAPCLLFFDEFDAIAHKRSFEKGDADESAGGGVYARILSTFLNEMDGVGSAGKAAMDGILVVAATNRKDALDAALIRPGRIDKSLELGYPDSEDIQEIVDHYARKMPLAKDVDLAALATTARASDHRVSGADLAAVCKEAAFRALREDLDAGEVCMRHFEAAWVHRLEGSPA